MMRPVLRPDARVLLTLHWDLDGDLRAVLLVLLGAVLFWNLLAVRHSVGLAVLLGNIVALGDGLVVAHNQSNRNLLFSSFIFPASFGKCANRCECMYVWRPC